MATASDSVVIVAAARTPPLGRRTGELSAHQFGSRVIDATACPELRDIPHFGRTATMRDR